MNNMRTKYLISILVLGLYLFSCSLEYPPGYIENNKEFEKKWGNCYIERFSFPEEKEITKTEFLKCVLGGKNVLINDQESGFGSNILYSYSGHTIDSIFPLGEGENIQNKLIISFFNFEFFKGVSVVIKYPTDSLNYTIQKVFSSSTITCSSNFIDELPQFVISTNCKPNGRVLFSSLYSTNKNQVIRVDNFNYQFNNGKWFYHLEYSFDEIEVTNCIWNEKTKTDIYGKEIKSDIFVDNILIEDMKCVIEFELPED